MLPLPNEKVLLESNNGALVLTSHRVRFQPKAGGNAQMSSIMLEQLASCAVARSSKPLYLWLAIITVVLGVLASANSHDNGALMAGAVLGFIFLLIYLASQKMAIALASAGATIEANAQGMSFEAAVAFIDAVERAKNERYLLLASP